MKIYREVENTVIARDSARRLFLRILGRVSDPRTITEIKLHQAELAKDASYSPDGVAFGNLYRGRKGKR